MTDAKSSNTTSSEAAVAVGVPEPKQVAAPADPKEPAMTGQKRESPSVQAETVTTVVSEEPSSPSVVSPSTTAGPTETTAAAAVSYTHLTLPTTPYV